MKDTKKNNGPENRGTRFYDPAFLEQPGKTGKVNDSRENAVKNSVSSSGKPKNTKKSNKVRKTFRKGFAVLAMVALIAGSVAATKLGEKIAKDKAVNQYFCDYQYYESIDACKWGQEIDGQCVDGYNQSELAKWASQTEDPNLALFSIYRKNQKTGNVNWNMNEVISRMGTYGENNECYDDFAHYLTANGFVDGKGNPSTAVYEREMTEIVLATKALSEYKYVKTK